MPDFSSLQVGNVTSINDYHNIINYGRIGVGKTHLVATAQNYAPTSNLLFVSAEGGEDTLRNIPNGDEIDVVRINNYHQIQTIYEFLTLHIKYRDKYLMNDEEQYKDKLCKLEKKLKGLSELPTEPTIYRSVAIDSLTELQQYAMYMVLDIDLNDTKLDDNPATPSRNDWGENSELVKKLVRSFRDLKIHTFFNCLEKKDKDDENEILVAPKLPGQLATDIPGFVDVVGRLYKSNTDEGTKRVLLTQRSGKYLARVRGGDLGQYIMEPTIEKIFKGLED